MKDIESMNYHPLAEQLVDVLRLKTQNDNSQFFRIITAYYFCKVASMMRVNIATKDRGEIPVNMYAINLAPSGFGKGLSTNVIEEHVINQFKERFLEETFPEIAEQNLAKLAVKRAARKGIPDEDELVRVQKEFSELGTLAFSFDSGTTAAVKQMRHKLLMADAGSMNLEIDEIGSNLLGNLDVLNTFLELFDVGKVKQKLTKNTKENVRSEEIDGRTPTNLMLYGTPAKLFDGGKVEAEMISFLDTGYGRRCFFGFSTKPNKVKKLTPKEVFLNRINPKNTHNLQQLSDKLAQLADPINFGTSLIISDDVSIKLIEYQMECEDRASLLGTHEEIRKAELTHRYFKALKLAGAYAFIDGSHEVTEDHLYASIKLTEDSGEAFQRIMNRERPYVKLCDFIASVGRKVTHVDLVEELPFYKGSNSQKQDLLTMAITHGYQKNIIIKKMWEQGIEFFEGESLKATDTDQMLLSHSTDWTTGYTKEYAKFEELYRLTQLPNHHWVTHELIDGYRKEENAIPGFNMVVVDVDGTCDIDTAKLLLKDYKYLLHTTKSNSPDKPSFRVIFPISHHLKLDAPDFREFMNNIYEWLPFEVDTATGQRSRKWATHAGDYHYNDGDLIDALDFIPKTTKNEERKAGIKDLQSLSNIERWFITNTGTGNRSNQFIKYAYLLVDAGLNIQEIQDKILALNAKLADKMDDQEIISTIMVSASKAIHKRDTQ